jgi:oxaloacetate decarboxylase beta subunit|uniref:Sodium ion-translocating decarboxylase subunit beta n=1 Tax=Mesoaciditoga lauensis TaxID=1495039 RepID=A0A7V3VSH8_9BACT
MWVFMLALGIILIFLSVKFKLEPLLLVPIGFFIFLSNIPGNPLVEQGGLLTNLFHLLIGSELLPLLIFISIGAMMDFNLLISNPFYTIIGAFSQVGIFLTFLGATYLGFDLRAAASIASIGTADGPTSIYVTSMLKPVLIAPVSLAAYTYVSIVPLLIPPILKTFVSKKEMTVVTETHQTISKNALMIFPFVLILLVGLFAPIALPLIGFLMFGNFLRTNGQTQKLKETAEKELAMISTIFIAMLIGSNMSANLFFNVGTLMIFALGIVAFILNLIFGVLAGKFFHLFNKSFNPSIGAAGNSAFPMASRVVHNYVQKKNKHAFLLPSALSANAAGQIASAVAGTFLLQSVLTGKSNAYTIALSAFWKSTLVMIALGFILFIFGKFMKSKKQVER